MSLHDLTPLPNVKLLLIEPYEDTRKILTRLLKHLGAEVVAVGDVDKVTPAIDANPDVAVILTRRTLDYGHVFDFFPQWKARLPAARTILMSGYLGDDVVSRAKEQGMDAWLHVPMSINDLHATLMRVLAEPQSNVHPGSSAELK